MYVRTYVRMYVRTYIRTYVCMYVCMYTCTHVCMYVHIHACIHTDVCIMYIRILCKEYHFLHCYNITDVIIIFRGLLMPKIVVDDFGGARTDPGMLGSGIYFASSSRLTEC